MIIRYTIEASVVVPDGTVLGSGDREIVLPTGESLKPYVVLELNDDRDLTHTEEDALGVAHDDLVLAKEIVS
jgi:hypothetical protein